MKKAEEPGRYDVIRPSSRPTHTRAGLPARAFLSELVIAPRVQRRQHAERHLLEQLPYARVRGDVVAHVVLGG